MINRRYMCTALAAALIGTFLTPTAQGALIGPGTGIAGSSLDTAGSRLNISNKATALAAGVYDVTKFSWRETGSSAGGRDLQPFLATLNSPDDYTIIWIGGGTLSNGGLGTYEEMLVGQQFTLGTATNVYAGFNQEEAIVAFGSEIDGTDHTGSPTFANFFNKGVDEGTQYNSFTHPNLNRDYAFQIEVESANAAVPEPSSLAVLGIASIGLVAGGIRRRRKQKNS